MMIVFFLQLSLLILVIAGQDGLVLAEEGGSQVKGKVSFRGLVPVAKTLRVKADIDFCGKMSQVQTVQVDKATFGLRSAVVSIKNAPSFDMALPNSTRVVANATCVFAPRISAARLGDVLEIQNHDPILHNTHIKNGARTFLNVAQVVGSRPIPKLLKRSGTHVFRCDKHTFMTGTLMVFAHPYFAVTDELGHFQLPSVPSGTYTIVVWHETLGSMEKTVTVSSQGFVAINFEYL